MREMSRVIQASIRAGERVTRTAERLLDVDLPAVELPRYVEELSDAARFVRGPGDANIYRDVVQRFRGQISRLGQGVANEAGEYTIRSAGQQLVKDLAKAKPDQVEKVVNQWVLDRARYQARVVARHESVEAYRDVAHKSVEGQPWAVGIRWSLSAAHPRPDVCEVHAGADRYGLGPGGYPMDRVPDRHPSCLCIQTPIIDDSHFERELAQESDGPEPPKPWLTGKRETPEEWLSRQPEELQHAILGPTRKRMIKDGHKVLRGKAADFRPVHKMTGEPKPQRSRGPRIDASQVVREDRAKMVRPFPAL